MILKMSSTALGIIPLSIPVLPFRVKVLPPSVGPKKIKEALYPSTKFLTIGPATDL
jgi:hypothetical protein